MTTTSKSNRARSVERSGTLTTEEVWKGKLTEMVRKGFGFVILGSQLVYRIALMLLSLPVHYTMTKGLCIGGLPNPIQVSFFARGDSYRNGKGATRRRWFRLPPADHIVRDGAEKTAKSSGPDTENTLKRTRRC
jgi:hypothetical protein